MGGGGPGAAPASDFQFTARIVTEHFDGDAGRCWLTLMLERPVAIDKAATICGDCPRYVAGSLPCVDG